MDIARHSSKLCVNPFPTDKVSEMKTMIVPRRVRTETKLMDQIAAGNKKKRLC